MAIVLHGPAEIEALRLAGSAAAATLRHIASKISAGITTARIDTWVREDTRSRGATPSQLGYRGFPAAVCTSVNDVVCHGVPSDEVTLCEGDIVNVDVTSELDGFHGDTSRTFMLGQPSALARAVTQAAQEALEAGIQAVKPGARLGDVGFAVAQVARARGFHSVAEFGGHGIGRRMHMPPHVAHHGPPGRGLRLRPGMAFTIEPMIVPARVPLVVDEDGWTCRTSDASPSAQFEHTVLVTERGVEVLTAFG